MGILVDIKAYQIKPRNIFMYGMLLLAVAFTITIPML